MDIGARIRAARKEKGLTQEELGVKLGVSGPMIAQYETSKRKPKYETVERIAVVLGVDGNWLRNGKTLEQRDQEMKDYVKQRLEGLKAHKMPDAEAHKAGFLQFNSEEDRIAHFYDQCLNIDGKLAASKYFYQHLDKSFIKAAADYVEHLSEIPQFQPVKADEKEGD